MADFWDVAKGGLNFASAVAPSAINAVGNYRQAQQDYGAIMKNQQLQKQANDPNAFGKPSAENEFLNKLFLQQKLAPDPELELKQHPTQTDAQRWASNLALAGSIPGTIQQALPGLLGNIKKIPYVGKGAASLFEPDTSYLDELNDLETRKFREETIPQILAQYGEGDDQRRASALRAATADLQDKLIARKAQAYETGLERNRVNTNTLREAGMKDQFQYGYEPKKGPDVINEQLQITDPKTGSKVSFDEAVKHFDQGQKGIGKQFKAAYDKADFIGKKAINNTLERAMTKGKGITRDQIIPKLNTPENFIKYDTLKNVPDANIQKLIGKIQSTKELDTIYNLLQDKTPANEKKLNAILRKHAIIKKGSKGIDWELISGIVKPLAAFGGAAAAGAAGVPGAVASGVSSLVDMLRKKPNA